MPERELLAIDSLIIEIDRQTCIGSDNCTQIAPEVFVLGYDGVVTFQEDIGEIPRERLIEACAICPVDALIARDEDGNVIVPE